MFAGNMSGFLGGRWGSGKASSRKAVEDGLNAMSYRGPDGAGILIESVGRSEVCLAHNRLAILDLTDNALQPMHSGDGSLSIVFNGEIYNYVELREELLLYGFKFSTDSDTEVLLYAWRHWGHACLEKLTGMFAFAVLDRKSSKLTCVRDAFGVKPLFYKCVGEEFIFASEIGALRKLSGQSDSLNVQRAYDYLVHGDYDSGDQTFFTDILSLKPGHLLSLSLRDGVVSEPELWWRPSIIERPSVTFADAADELRELFLKSVRLHMRSDVPIAAALSGGIDSSAIVCAMRHVAPDRSISSFSYIAEGHISSEEQWVDQVNSYVGAIPNKIVANAQELLRDLPDMISAQGEPFGSSSIYAQYRVCQHAGSNGFKVLLEGQGADEMLGGYIGYPGQRLRSLLEKGEYARAWEFLGSWAQWPNRSRWGAIQRFVAEVAPDFLY
ncbi:MAG: asparagine synthase (glutamine-hydrolyzing), partial [Microcoleus sp.]